MPVTVPYSVRNSGDPLVISADDGNGATGTYTMVFTGFTAPTFEDNFDTDASNWNAGSNGRMGTVENGNMVLKLNDGDTKDFNISTSNFSQAYGAFSARIKMPEANGIAHAAFWLSTFNNNPYIPAENVTDRIQYASQNGEIDVVEYYTTIANKSYSALHWNCWNNSFLQSVNVPAYTLSTISSEYHIYSTVWTKTAIYYYCDGDLTGIVTEGMSEDSSPMKLKLQLKIGNANSWYAKNSSNTGLPSTAMYTDWVKAYDFNN